MRQGLCLLGIVALALITRGQASGQVPGAQPPNTVQIDEDRAILNQIKESYQAAREVPDNVLKELRKSYGQPSLRREIRMFRELSRLYALTPDRGVAIWREIRKAYVQRSVEQEKRVFDEIEKVDRLPAATVPDFLQVERALEIFRKLDVDRDGRLSEAEVPEMLRRDFRSCDTNHDNFLTVNEYWAHYQSRLRLLRDEVLAGHIDIGVRPRRTPEPAAPLVPEIPRPPVYRAGKLPKTLPAWFTQLDRDRDGQVSLAEWRRSGKSVAEFAAFDRNNDGLLTPQEVLYHVAHQSESRR